MGRINELKGFTRGQLDAALMKIGDDVGMSTADGINAFLRGELVLSSSRRWREKDGIIYFTVTSDGTTGEEWIKRLRKKGCRICDDAIPVLRSPDFKATSGVTTEIAVLTDALFKDEDRLTSKIRAFAGKRKLTTPNAEVACLIREAFSDKELEAMGLMVVLVMHESIKVPFSSPQLLSSSGGSGGRLLDAYNDYPGRGWSSQVGFAFVSQVKSKT